MGGNHIDARRVVDELKADVNQALPPNWAPTLIRREDLEALVDLPSLDYLHRHWALNGTIEDLSMRRTWGRPKALARAWFNRMLRASLRHYFEQEQQLFSHMVRCHDAAAKRCDALELAQMQATDAIQADLVELVGRLRAQLDRLEELLPVSNGA